MNAIFHRTRTVLALGIVVLIAAAAVPRQRTGRERMSGLPRRQLHLDSGHGAGPRDAVVQAEAHEAASRTVQALVDVARHVVIGCERLSRPPSSLSV